MLLIVALSRELHATVSPEHSHKMDSADQKGKTEGPRDHDSFDESECHVEVIPSFDEMPLHTNLLRGIYSYGFEKPSAIQQRAIVPFIKGGDIIAQAQSGTGASSCTPKCCAASMLGATSRLAE